MPIFEVYTRKVNNVARVTCVDAPDYKKAAKWVNYVNNNTHTNIANLGIVISESERIYDSEINDVDESEIIPGVKIYTYGEPITEHTDDVDEEDEEDVDEEDEEDGEDEDTLDEEEHFNDLDDAAYILLRIVTAKKEGANVSLAYACVDAEKWLTEFTRKNNLPTLWFSSENEQEETND